MTGDKFDKELAALYRERKAEIVEPYVDLKIDNRKVKYSPLRILSIFLVAGSVSFGIMAIVSHFATLPTSAPKPVVTMHVTTLQKPSSIKSDKDTLPLATPLPPKPDVIKPIVQAIVKPNNDSVDAQVNISIKNEITVHMVALPQLIPPLSVIEPTFKVLPRYANSDAQEGQVELSYHVDNSGNVINIKVVDSNVNRALQRSAKKALSKWRYNANTPKVNEFKVRFKFTQAEG